MGYNGGTAHMCTACHTMEPATDGDVDPAPSVSSCTACEGSDPDNPDDVTVNQCTAAVCAGGYIPESYSCANDECTSRACAPCTPVDNAAADATYTCSSASDSRVSACGAGLTKVEGGDGAADTCICDDGRYLIDATEDGQPDHCNECTPVDNAAADATYTCSSVSDSRVSACGAGLTKVEGGD